MDAIVLCGGKGTRVSKLTKDEIPKILLPVSLGVPFIEHLVQVLLMRGCYRICFSTGFLGDQIETYVNDVIKKRAYGDFLFPTFASDDDYFHKLGTGGGAIWAASLLRDEPDYSKFYEPYVLVVNGDSILFPGGCDQISADREVKTNTTQDFLKCDPDIMMYTGWTKNDGSMGMVEVYEGKKKGHLFPGRITGFKEKQKGEGEVNLGWYIIRKELLSKEFPTPCSLEYDLFPRWLEEGMVFEQIETDWVNWYEIGTPKGINRYQKYMKERLDYKIII